MGLRILQVEIEKYEESEAEKNWFSRKQVTTPRQQILLESAPSSTPEQSDEILSQKDDSLHQ